MSELSLRPKISIIIPTYNSERYLPFTLDALLTQQGISFKEIEIIFIDGGSRDSTINIITDFVKKYGNFFADFKIIIHDRNYGVSKARNDGIRSSRGRYILLLDSDVKLPPNALSRLVNFIERHGELNIAGVKALHLTPQTIKGNLTIELLQMYSFLGVNREFYSVADVTLVRREVFEEVGLYREDMGPPFSTYEDWELGERIKKAGYRIIMLGDLIAIHKPLPSSSEDSLTRSILIRLSEYISFQKAKALYNVFMSMPLVDRFLVGLVLSIIDVSLLLIFYGVISSRNLFTAIGFSLFICLYLLYMFYSLALSIYHGNRNLRIKVLSISLIYASRIIRYKMLELFLIFKVCQSVARFTFKLKRNERKFNNSTLFRC